jgi:sister-chromatid-cohesion protein PDS5
VKELVMKDVTAARGGDDSWCEFDDLCLETQSKVEGMKMMARWLLGLKSDEVAAQKTFRMLNAIIENGGDLLEEGKPNPAERAWLRLSAGCAMLKVCEQKGVGDQFTTEQYYTLSKLVTDPVVQVREQFLVKLHKGLGRGIPNKCLPLDFMGMFALAGLEADKRLRGLAKQFMVNNINKRREYMKTVLQSGGSEKASAQLPHIMPDYMLVFAVAVLTHDPAFTVHTDVEYLKRIRLALWFVLEPLMTKNENYSFGFYQELIQKMKNHRDAFKGDDEAVNHKLWAVCDLAMGIITTRTTNFERKEFLSDVRIPPMYFKAEGDPNQQNIKSYLPAELQHSAPKKAANIPVGAPLGPPMYTVSGQLAGRSKVADTSADMDDPEAAEESSEGSSEETAGGLGKRPRRGVVDDGGPAGKRDKL